MSFGSRSASGQQRSVKTPGRPIAPSLSVGHCWSSTVSPSSAPRRAAAAAIGQTTTMTRVGCGPTEIFSRVRFTPDSRHERALAGSTPCLLLNRAVSLVPHLAQYAASFLHLIFFGSTRGEHSNAMSALPPKADMCSALTHVRLVPIAGIASKKERPPRGGLSFKGLIGLIKRTA